MVSFVMHFSFSIKTVLDSKRGDCGNRFYNAYNKPKLGYQWVLTSKPVEVWVPITELHYVG